MRLILKLRSHQWIRSAGVALVACGLVAGSACGRDSETGSGQFTVVVSSTILGDIVRQVAGAEVDVDVLLPAGADPHDFAPSARQAERAIAADLLVVNGAGFEAGLDRLVDSAEQQGVAVFAFADHVDLIESGESGAPDPHVWTDPVRMAGAVRQLGKAMRAVDGAPAAVVDRAETYAERLTGLDATIEQLLAGLPPDRRVLVTNHEVLAYFADRYRFEVVGTVIPSLSTGAEPSAGGLDELAGLIDRLGVPAIFVENTTSGTQARALARTLDGVEVVELYSESLGGPGSGAATYVEMMTTNARRIAAALA